MEEPLKETKEENKKEVILDFLKEVTGYESGFGRTLIDLRKKPDVVLEAYLNHRGGYVSPFRLLFSVLGIWLFVNSFIIDWYTVWYDLMNTYTNFLMDHVYQFSLEKKLKTAASTEKMIRLVSRLAGDLFSKYYVPFVILVLPVSSWFAVKFCRPYNLSFRSILGANTYAIATSTFIGFFMVVGLAISSLITLGIMIVLMILAFTGRNFIQVTPISRFYTENGRVIERKTLLANFTAVSIIMSVGAGIYFAVNYFSKA